MRVGKGRPPGLDVAMTAPAPEAAAAMTEFLQDSPSKPADKTASRARNGGARGTRRLGTQASLLQSNMSVGRNAHPRD